MQMMDPKSPKAFKIVGLMVRGWRVLREECAAS